MTKAEHAAYMRAWRAGNRDRAREISRNGSLKYRDAHPEKLRASQAKHRDKIRLEIFAFFGGECVRCGFSDTRALQLDHVNGDGMRGRNWYLGKRYKYIKDHPDEARMRLQLLCANCNWIKRVDNGEYACRTKRKGDE
jgi:hypothetical protein